MCGLVGFIESSIQGTSAIEAEHALRRMSGRLRHRGPDDEGFWIDRKAGVFLGHRRLAIVDLSPHGRQPMVSSCGRWVIAFNGEIYNHRTLRADLGEPAHGPWRGHSDTETLVEAISRWGIGKALERCNGMFAIAAWDRSKRQLHLARDPIGEKPLYFGTIEGRFVFASELKAIMSVASTLPDVDPEAVSQFVSHGFISAPATIFRGISKLTPGTRLTIVPGPREVEIEESVLWSARSMVEGALASPFTGSPQDAISELERLLRQAVALRMEADVPVGALLSGGIDSSLVVALMQAQSARTVQTFSIGFSEAAYNEAPHARAVAQHLGTEHHELYLSPQEAMAVVPDLPRVYDEPFADPSQIPTLLVSRFARQSVTVVLSGDGGDELFLGYDNYRWGARIWSQFGTLPAPARRAASALIRTLPPSAWDRVLSLLPSKTRRELSGHRLHRVADLLKHRTLDDITAALASHCPEPWHFLKEPAGAGIAERSRRPPRLDPYHHMAFADLTNYLPEDILVKVDRASMSVGLEGRIPLLDPAVVAFAWRLPLSLKIHAGREKWIMRELLSRFVPTSLIDRPKQGFAVPVGQWLRGPLRDWAEAMLAPDRLNQDGIFQVSAIRRLWNEHSSGQRNWQHLLWHVLMLQVWLDEARRSQTAHEELVG